MTAMEYRQLGRSGVQIAPLVLGTDNFGTRTEAADAHRIMDRAHELGINMFDTADVYGWRTGEGLTETILGDWFALGGGRRERTVLSTKVYGATGDGPNDRRLSARHLRQACDASLRRLRTDHLDVYHFHHVDRLTPWEEIWEAIDVLRHQGKVLYVGTSNHPAWQLVKGQEAAARRGALGIVCEQDVYNLIERRIELEVLPACDDYGIALLPWSPLHSGLLGGILARPAAEASATPLPGASVAPSRAGRTRALERHRAALERFEAACAEWGLAPAHVALAWLRQRPGVCAPIIGPRTVGHLDDAVAALDVRLDEAMVDRLEEIFPGPGPAPEAYAW